MLGVEVLIDLFDLFDVVVCVVICVDDEVFDFLLGVVLMFNKLVGYICLIRD